MLMASSGGAQALLFAANFCLIFFYSTEVIASYGFYITIGSLFSVISSLRLDYFAFFSKVDDQARGLVLSVGLVFVGISSVSLILISLLFNVFGRETFFLVLSVFSFSFYYLISQYSLMVKDYAGYGTSRLLLGLLFLFLLVGLASKGDVLHLLVSYCTAQTVSGLYLWRRNKIRLTFNILALKYGVFFRFRDRLINTLSTCIQFLSPALPIILGGYFFNMEILGAFFWMSQMLGAAAAIVKRSLMGYLSAELMHNGELQVAIVEMAGKIFLWGAAGSIASCILLSAVFNYISQQFPSWSPYVNFLPALVLLYCSDALVQPLGSLLSSIQREKTHLLIEIGRLLLVLVCFSTAAQLDLDIYWFVWGYSIVMSFFYFLGGAIFCYVSRCGVMIK
ncbi:hypothetical protein SAMN03159293_02372 [Pseudomonas sp. NFACC39-1]|nr:hypothetical protein SAMN03159293_02372 [Pseudomonas sp. NFACC39-1]